MTTYKTKINLATWQEINEQANKVRQAAADLDQLLLNKGLEQANMGDERGMELLVELSNQVNVDLPDVAPHSEWVGGENWKWREPRCGVGGCSNWKWREPRCVGGCSFPAYFDDEGNPQR